MTEPVAYLNKYLDNSTNITRYKPENQRLLSSKPLYTSEDLHPRVKMTKKQSDDFKSLHAQFDLLSDGINAIYEIEHLPMKSWIVNGKLRENEMLIAGIWGEYDLDNPEETIEIVPDMKWFVRSKKRDDEGDFEFISGIETPDAWGYSKHHNGVNDPRACAYAFDTKEEAEKWTNPLTEAVQLPVEDE